MKNIYTTHSVIGRPGTHPRHLRITKIRSDVRKVFLQIPLNKRHRVLSRIYICILTKSHIHRNQTFQIQKNTHHISPTASARSGYFPCHSIEPEGASRNPFLSPSINLGRIACTSLFRRTWKTFSMQRGSRSAAKGRGTSLRVCTW